MSGYSPWEISSSQYPENGSFNDQARFLIRYAILAPNSHNTQPWKFSIQENCILIYPDLDRSLVFSDRTGREMNTSLGCALANLLIAADNFGFSNTVDYFPEDITSGAVARVNLKTGKKLIVGSDLFSQIVKRSTTRGNYLPKPISQQTFENLLSKIKHSDVQIKFITDSDRISEISQLVSQASIAAFSEEIFREELATWVRPNKSTESDGMPGFGFGLSDEDSLEISEMILKIPTQVQAQMDSEVVSKSPSLLVFSTPSDSPIDWLKTGMVYEYFSLAAIEAGLATAPMAGVIEYPPTRAKLTTLITLKSEVPTFFARLGYPQNLAPHSPRRDVSSVLV